MLHFFLSHCFCSNNDFQIACPLLVYGWKYPQRVKKRHICAVFSLYASCFVIFALRSRCVSSANEYWFGVWAMICCWLFHCGFVDGCFIADEYFFVGECFFWGEGMRKAGGVDGLVWLDEGMVGDWPKVFLRARVCALPSYEFCFLLSQVSQRMGLKILHHPQNDVSFYGKWRVVLLKTTCRFVESDGLFGMGGRKVVLRMVFWGFLGVE